jgi:rRNA maturation endonuclease Nob1
MEEWNKLTCQACGNVLSDHNKDELESCKLVSEIVNIQKPVIKKEGITKPKERCEKCSLYQNMGNAVCTACGFKY